MIQPLRRKISTAKACGDGYAGEVGFRADAGHRRLMSGREGMIDFGTSKQFRCRSEVHDESLRAGLLSQGSAGSCEGEGEVVTRRLMRLGLGAFSAALAPEKEDFRGELLRASSYHNTCSVNVFASTKSCQNILSSALETEGVRCTNSYHSLRRLSSYHHQCMLDRVVHLTISALIQRSMGVSIATEPPTKRPTPSQETRCYDSPPMRSVKA